jgi:hypothetical protein
VIIKIFAGTLPKEMFEVNNLGQVVVYNKTHQDDEKEKTCLNDFLFQPEAEVFPNQPLHK